MSKKIKNPLSGLIASNKRARHDYELLEKFEAGIALQGSEVKALRASKVSLSDSWVEIYKNEAWLQGANIAEYGYASWTNHAPKRKRKLLLHRREIDKLSVKTTQKGLTLVPLQMYFKNGRAKLELAIGRGKREYDKRQALRERQDNLEAARSMRSREIA